MEPVMDNSARYSAYPDIADSLPPIVSLNDIPAFPRAAYEVDVGWDYLERQLEYFKEYGLDLDPDFQREHVWTAQQKTAYIEYVLMGGELSKTLVFAADNWHVGTTRVLALLDGKQRLEAVRGFLRGEVYAFRRTFQELKGPLRMVKHGFRFRVVELRSRADMLKLYLALNIGGTPHAPEEIQRVQALLVEELKNPTPFELMSKLPPPKPEPALASTCEATKPNMTAGRLDALEVLRGVYLRGESASFMHSYVTQMRYLAGFNMVRRVPSNGGGPKWKWAITDAGLALIDKARPREPKAT